MGKVKSEADKRWEFCPECGDGWPNYLGLRKGYQEFSCSLDECEAYYRVPEGKGEYDKRLRMELAPNVIYLENCNFCEKRKPVKLKNARFVCADCFSDSHE